MVVVMVAVVAVGWDAQMSTVGGMSGLAMGVWTPVMEGRLWLLKEWVKAVAAAEVEHNPEALVLAVSTVTPQRAIPVAASTGAVEAAWVVPAKVVAEAAVAAAVVVEVVASDVQPGGSCSFSDRLC